MTSIRNFTEERLRLLFHQLFMHLPLLIFHGQRTGLEKFRAWEWVGLNDHGLALQQKHVPRNQLLETNILVTHAAIPLEIIVYSLAPNTVAVDHEGSINSHY